MEICVFGETIEADQESYEKLLNRIFVEVFHTDSPVFRRLDNLIIRGKGDLVTQLPINLRSITRKFSNISCAFVFLDADGEYPSKTNSERKRVRDKVSNFKETFAGEIIIGVPTRNIEAWLLSDSNNLIFNTKLSNLPSYTKVEEIEKPKEILKGIYTQYLKKTNTPLPYSDFVTQLFSTINIDSLKLNSKSFEKFLKDLRAYLQREGVI